MKKIAIKAICIGAVLAAGAYVGKKTVIKLNSRVKRAIAKEAPPSFFTNLGWRNLDSIVIGSTKAWKCLKPFKESERVMSLAYYDCSKWAQYSVLRCYFSHLAPKGTAILVIDPFERGERKKGTPLDTKFIHNLIFRAEGGRATKRVEQYPLVYKPIWSYDFMDNRRKKKHGDFENLDWSNLLVKKDYRIDRVFINTMRDFCDVRDIKLKVIILACETPGIVEQLTECGVEGVDFCKNAKELNDMLHSAKSEL